MCFSKTSNMHYIMLVNVTIFSITVTPMIMRQKIFEVGINNFAQARNQIFTRDTQRSHSDIRSKIEAHSLISKCLLYFPRESWKRKTHLSFKIRKCSRVGSKLKRSLCDMRSQTASTQTPNNCATYKTFLQLNIAKKNVT